MLNKIGTVSKAFIYPIKGMQGVPMDRIFLKSISIVGDRARAYIINDSNRTPNFLDTIQFPQLLKYKPIINETNDPQNSKTFLATPGSETYDINILTPEGNIYPADSVRLREEIEGKTNKSLSIMRIGRGAYHSMPISLLTLASVKKVEEQINSDIDIRRFRENIILDTVSAIPFEEDTWISKTLQFGEGDLSAKIAIVKLDKRCATVNLEPETGTHSPEILKYIANEHNNTFGVYANVLQEGYINLGDNVYLANT